MSEAKHTPGPWIAGMKVIKAVGGNVVVRSAGSPMSVADAYLIAAAPDMLAALKGYIALFDRGAAGHEVRPDEMLAARIAMCDAINKAEGRS